MRSKYEIKAQKELEAEGYIVDNKAGMGRFSKNRDFWNLFDLVAVYPRRDLRYISIKGHQGIPSQHLKDVSEFWLPDCCQKEIWHWPKRKKKTEGFIKRIINDKPDYS